jgi:hypothetical protein
MANNLVSTGMLAAWYNHIFIDDVWTGGRIFGTILLQKKIAQTFVLFVQTFAQIFTSLPFVIFLKNTFILLQNIIN